MGWGVGAWHVHDTSVRIAEAREPCVEQSSRDRAKPYRSTYLVLYTVLQGSVYTKYTKYRQRKIVLAE